MTNLSSQDATGGSKDLSRRIEEASINAWPSLHQVLYDGWLLRFSRGFTKRANCVVPLYPSERATAEETAEKIRHCENLYARDRLATIFRLTDDDDHRALSQALTDRGYQRHDATDVLAKPLTDAPIPKEFRQLGHNEWLDLYATLTGVNEDATKLHGMLLRGIRTETCYGAVFQADEPVGCGLAVIEQDLVGLFDVVTAISARGQGHGRSLVDALAAWGHGEGAVTAYLQVVADNAPAQRLYARLNYQIAHRYHYYSRPEDSGRRRA